MQIHPTWKKGCKRLATQADFSWVVFRDFEKGKTTKWEQQELCPCIHYPLQRVTFSARIRNRTGNVIKKITKV